MQAVPAEPYAAADRRGRTAFQGSTVLQPRRLLSWVDYEAVCRSSQWVGFLRSFCFGNCSRPVLGPFPKQNDPVDPGRRPGPTPHRFRSRVGDFDAVPSSNRVIVNPTRVVHGHEQTLVIGPLPGEGEEVVRGSVPVQGGPAFQLLPLPFANHRVTLPPATHTTHRKHWHARSHARFSANSPTLQTGASEGRASMAERYGHQEWCLNSKGAAEATSRIVDCAPL